jgi:predicted metal-dependent HD superfamily phosphohydrolase
VAQAVLPSRLISLLSSWGASQDAVAGAAVDLIARYEEPHRRYHTLEHIDDMLAVADRLAATDEVTCAVWLHDVIYDPTQTDNEARSAAFARGLLQRLDAPASLVEEVARLVESTAQHDPDDGDHNGQVLADADLAILGAPADRYERYVRDARAEYAHASDDDWRRGRAAVVRSFLDRPLLYHSWQLRDSREQRARENLRAELVALTAS